MKLKTSYLAASIAVAAAMGISVVVGQSASANEVCTPVPTPTNSTTGVVPVGVRTVFTENFDKGFSQWNSVQTHYYNGSASGYTKPGYSLRTVDAGVDHTTALRTEVRDGDTAVGSHERAELSGFGKPGLLANSGDDLWYEFDVKFGDSAGGKPWKTPQAWTIISQWHAAHADGAPPVALAVHSDNKVYFEMEADDVVRPFIPVWDVRPDQWEHVAIHIGWSPDPKVGFIEAYVNGTQVLARTAQQTMYHGDTRDTYMKIGTYRRSSNVATSVVYHDNLRISGA